MKLIEFIKKLKKDTDRNLLYDVKSPYQRLVESIDDLELCEMFLDCISQDEMDNFKKYGSNPYEYELETKISENTTIELAKKFFEAFGLDISQKINSILDFTNKDIKIKMENYNGRRSETSNPNKIPIEVYVPIRGDIRQLYELVHELTHTLDIENGDTETRKVLGEVAPQCMERILDDFLFQLSGEEMQKYGFDKDTLIKDINDRRISTFVSRYKNAILLENHTGFREDNSRYMLAQIYQAQFNKYDKNEKISKIREFIECINNNDFIKANHTFGMKLEKENQFHRKLHIASVKDEIESLLNPYTDSSVKEKENIIEKDSFIK